MSVYVSEIFETIRTTKWHWNQYAYLMADSIKELHAFARRIGLKRSWFQDNNIPHYDITVSKRQRAIRSGAIQDTARNMLRRYRNEDATQIYAFEC